MAWIAVCALLMLPPAPETSTPIDFGGIRWGSPAAVVKARMVERGFRFEKVDEDGDLKFSGSINGERAVLYAFRTHDDQLVKWSIAIFPPDHRTVAYYRELKRELMTRYGEAIADIETWDFPYANGAHVGHEEAAIVVGKGILKAGWATGGELPGVVIAISDRLSVNANYEGPGWNEEAARRKSRMR